MSWESSSRRSLRLGCSFKEGRAARSKRFPDNGSAGARHAASLFLKPTGSADSATF